VHEVARISAAWAQRLESSTDSRGLLLKVSAGLALAAAAPVMAAIQAAPIPRATATAGNDRLAGVWRSRYVYYSSGRTAEFEGEHNVVLRSQGGRLVGQSLPDSLDSRLRLDLSVDGAVATGTWSERTSPTGYYHGATYHGTIQLVVDPLGRSMNGKWLGFGKNFSVNSGTWELAWIDSSASSRTMREYHLRARS